jgi:hypothetical protein
MHIYHAFHLKLKTVRKKNWADSTMYQEFKLNRQRIKSSSIKDYSNIRIHECMYIPNV